MGPVLLQQDLAGVQVQPHKYRNRYRLIRALIQIATSSKGQVSQETVAG